MAMALSIKRKSIDGLVSIAVLIVIVVYPVFLLSVRSAMSTCLVVLVVLCLYGLIKNRAFQRVKWGRGEIAITIALSSLMIATLISQVVNHSFRTDALDNPSRLLFAIPIYLALRHSPLPLSSALEYGLPLGVFTGFATSIFFPPIYWSIQGTYFVDPAQFAGAILMLGFLSAASINWSRKDPVAIVALKLAAFAVAVYCGMRSGERGIWIAIPVLLAVWGCYTQALPFKPAAKISAITATIAVLAIGGYLAVPGVDSRVSNTWHEITSVQNGKLDTSIGQRLQMWRAGIEIVRTHPIAGVGPAGPTPQLRSLSEQGWLTPIGLDAALSQMHNEILADTIRLGVFGLLAILAVYFVPLFLFVGAAASTDRTKQMAAVMGMLFVSGYFIFGLTIETFNIKMVASFYAVTVVILLAIARNEAPFPNRIRCE